MLFLQEVNSDADVFEELAEEQNGKDDQLQKDLRQIFVENHATHTMIDRVLSTLIQYGHKGLPKTARTLLKTATITEKDLKQISGGQYFYFGFQRLKEIAKKTNATNFQLSLNIDGLPISKSGSAKSSLWPILCRVENIPNPEVFPVALLLTSAKPSDLCFLNECINDLITLENEGLAVDRLTVFVELKQVICDAPARAMCKQIKLCTGYHGCDHCEIKGEYKYRKIIYANESEARTNESFRNKQCPQHHIGDSPFCRLSNLDMIKCWPICSLHQVLLGVQRRLLTIWLSEPKGLGRLAKCHIDAINTMLSEINRGGTPLEFARKPRSLSHVKHFKGTEYRLFLLYTGVVVLKSHLSAKQYRHFLLFNVSMRILFSRDLARCFADRADKYLKRFVNKFAKLYGEHHMVYNVHSMLHIASHVLQYGSLNECSAFPFENYMQVFKKLIRQRRAPLVELVRRLKERENISDDKPSPSPLAIDIRSPNNVYLTKAGEIVEIQRLRYIAGEGGQLERAFLCRKYVGVEDLYTKPCPSSLVGVYLVDPHKTCLSVVTQKNLGAKCFKITTNSQTVMQTLLH